MSFFIIGLVAFPTTMFISIPLECTVCSKNLRNCEFMYDGDSYKPGFNPVDQEKNFENLTRALKLHHPWWVKNYCTMNQIRWFDLYFPYILLFLPLIMVDMEKGFVR